MKARRRRVVTGVSLLGTGLLGITFSTQPGSKRFYGLTATVAATWAAGGVLSGPLHLGWIQSRDRQLRRPIITPIATGAGRPSPSSMGAHLVVRRIPVPGPRGVQRPPRSPRKAGHPPSWRLLWRTALAEGLSGAPLYSALDADRAVVVSTAVYTLATASTRNPALMLAAGVMGTLFSLQRRASGGFTGAGHHPPDLVDLDGDLPAQVVPPRPSARILTLRLISRRGPARRFRHAPRAGGTMDVVATLAPHLQDRDRR